MTTNKRDFFELTLDILNGCQFSCSGCRVNKTSHEVPEEKINIELLNFVRSAIDHGKVLTNVEVGPTDILSATNLNALMESKALREILTTAQSVVFSATFLRPQSDSYRQLADLLEVLVPHQKVKFIIPVELHHLDNITYIEKIKTNLEVLTKYVSTVDIYKVYANFRIDITDSKMASFSSVKLSELLVRAYGLSLHPNTNVDFIVPHGRYTYTETESRGLIDTMVWLNEAYRIIHENGLSGPVINDLNQDEGVGWDITFSNGELVIGAFINEKRFSLMEDTIVPRPWTVDSIVMLKELNTIDNLTLALDNDLCMRCPGVSLCSERGVPKIMDMLGTTRCLSPMGGIINPLLKN